MTAVANTSRAQAHYDRVEVGGSCPAYLALETCGQGQPFVWGHGLLASMGQDLDGGVLAWRELNDILQVIRYDARGHGESENSGEPEDFRWDNLARNMWEVTDSFSDQAVILGGASMGCATALHAACQRPQQVRGLVLVIPPTAWEWREPRRGGYRFTAGLVKYTRGLPFRLLGLLPLKERAGDFGRSVTAVMCRHLKRVKPRGVVGAMLGAALSDLPPREQLAALDIPVLILAWPGDRTHPLEVAEELHRIMPRAQLEVTDQQAGPYGWPQKVREFIAALD